MMRVKIFFTSLLFFSVFPFQVLAKGRTIYFDDQNCQIRTSLGFATILQLPVKPQNILIGDGDSFKVETLGTNISIKPLVRNGKTNLFISHDSFKMSCLVFAEPSGRQPDLELHFQYRSESDTNGKDGVSVRASTRTTKIHRKEQKQGVTIQIIEIEQSSDRSDSRGANILHFSVQSKRFLIPISSGSFGVRVGKNFIEIESLFLEEGAVPKGSRPISGKIAILNHSLGKASSLILVFAFGNPREKKVYRLEVPISLLSSSKMKAVRGAEKNEKGISLFPETGPKGSIPGAQPTEQK